MCKTDFYKRVKRKKRNEIGIYEEVEVYEIHDEKFPGRAWRKVRDYASALGTRFAR